MAHDPRFSSGPTKKPNTTKYGRSHRALLWVKKIQELIAAVREHSKIPNDFKVALMPASATGAMEALMFNLLGERKVDVFRCDIFGDRWYNSVLKHLDINDYNAPYGSLPDLTQYNPANDAVFVYNCTSTGIQVPNLDWIPLNRDGLTICDATSYAFCLPLDWSKLDGTAFSLAKGLGSEGGLGVAILSPRAWDRINSYTPKWPMPHLFNFHREGLFEGNVLNTPSLAAIDDALECFSLLGDYEAKTRANFKVIKDFVEQNEGWKFLGGSFDIVSKVSPCITFDKFKELKDYQILCKKLEEDHIAYDVIGYPGLTPCLRFWCGPTIHAADLAFVLDYIRNYTQNCTNSSCVRELSN